MGRYEKGQQDAPSKFGKQYAGKTLWQKHARDKTAMENKQFWFTQNMLQLTRPTHLIKSF